MGLRNDDPRPAAVYRWFAFTGRLLYIGCSHDPDKRWAEIQSMAGWSRLAAWRTLTWYETAREALQAERDAIRTEGPLLNIVRTRGGKGGTICRVLDVPGSQPVPCLHIGGSQWKVGAEDIGHWMEHLQPTVDAAALALIRKVQR